MSSVKMNSSNRVNKKILMVMALMVASNVEAQVYTGRITSGDSSLYLRDIKITNLHTNSSSSSQFDGTFSIAAKPTDSIAFQHPHWKERKIVAGAMPSLILLYKKDLVLEEIVIVGNTKAAKIQSLEKLKKDRAVRDGIHFDGKPPLYLLNPFGGPYVTFFYELFSKAGINARRTNKFIKQELENIEVDQIFNKNSIQGIIDLNDEELENFIVRYRPSLSETKNWNTYDLHVYVKNSYADFIKNPVLTKLPTDSLTIVTGPKP